MAQQNSSEEELDDTVELSESELEEQVVEDEEVVEEESAEEAPLDSKVLAKRLKDTQAKLTELAQANSELKGKLSVLDRPVQEEAPADPFASLDEEEAVTNPMLIAKAAQNANAALTRDVVGVLKEMRNEMLREIRQNDPERLALKTVIDELKSDPELADLDDSVLLKIAKSRKRSTPSRTVSRPSSAPGGGTRASSPAPKDLRQTSLYQEIYGELLKEAKAGDK